MKPLIILDNTSSFEYVYRIQKLQHKTKSKLAEKFVNQFLEADSYADFIHIANQYANFSDNQNNNSFHMRKRFNDANTNNSIFDYNDSDDDNDSDGDIIK